MQQDPAKSEWIARVLGYRAAEGAAADADGLVSLWQSAKDSADAELTKLSDALRKADVPVLSELATRIESLLAPVRVRMPKVLADVERSPGDAKARADALAAVRSAGEWIADNRQLGAVEANPLGMPIRARSIIGTALTQIEQQISRS
jgi:hypothetical protein